MNQKPWFSNKNSVQHAHKPYSFGKNVFANKEIVHGTIMRSASFLRLQHHAQFGRLNVERHGVPHQSSTESRDLVKTRQHKWSVWISSSDRINRSEIHAGFSTKRKLKNGT